MLLRRIAEECIPLPYFYTKESGKNIAASPDQEDAAMGFCQFTSVSTIWVWNFL